MRGRSATGRDLVEHINRQGTKLRVREPPVSVQAEIVGPRGFTDQDHVYIRLAVALQAHAPGIQRQGMVLPRRVIAIPHVFDRSRHDVERRQHVSHFAMITNDRNDFPLVEKQRRRDQRHRQQQSGAALRGGGKGPTPRQREPKCQQGRYDAKSGHP